MRSKNRYIHSTLRNSEDHYALNKQDGQCSKNVTSRRVRVTDFAVQ
jgi:hypothetical protein